MKRQSRWLNGAFCAAILAVFSSGAAAQEKFPSRPIQMIVPSVPGGGVDAANRLLAELVEPMLGQKVVVVNKPGGGGAVGTALVVQAKPDGYTIGGVWNAPLTMAPHILQVPYGLNDYVPVAQTTETPTIICADKGFPANNGQELIALLKSNPGKYTYGNDGIGSITQMSTERVFNALGVKARPIPFDGASETLKAFLGGQIDLYGGSVTPIKPYVQKGTAKCLLVTSVERNKVLTDATSLKELGIPNEATSNWRGIIVPKDVPADRIAILEKAFVAAAQSDVFRKAVESRGEDVNGASGAEMRKRIDAEYVAMEQVAQTIGLKK